VIVVAAADETREVAAKRDPHHVRRDALHPMHRQETAARLMTNASDDVFGHGDP